ncbi:MAG TPA: CBS domain-containing protein [Gammaproteobacteria bacterium]|nr:CBS domain-containing protein [Gammaproteobacteria bacterium]
MAKLDTHLLPAGVRAAAPDLIYPRATPDDPATNVMTDLRRHRAVSIQEFETLTAAERRMIGAGVRLLLVVNPNGEITGVVTYRDLTGTRALAAATRERIAHADLAVGLVMTPAAQTEALDYSALKHARVRDVLELLGKEGRQHTLVTETTEGRTVLRGIFSTTQIGRQLGVPIEPGERAHSFAEIEQLIAHV